MIMYDNDKFSTKLITYDWCNELLRIHLMTTACLSKLKDDAELLAVHRIQLKLKDRECLSIRFRHLDLVILKDWFIELPSLKVVDLRSCQLKELDPAIFQSLVNLEELYLFYNFIECLHAETFSSLKSIKNLQLNHNQICELDRNLFQGLSYLKELDLSSNSIRLLPEGLFRDLTSLEILNLSENSIDFVNEEGDQQGASVFQGLANLNDLDLGYNRITCIPEGMFECLHSLKVLYLHENRISEYPLLKDSVDVILGEVEDLDDTFYASYYDFMF